MRFLLLVFFIVSSVASAQTIYSTRAFTETFNCDGTGYQKDYKISDSVGGHPAITASSINIVGIWKGDYNDGAAPARLLAFRTKYNGATMSGQHFLIVDRGQREYPVDGGWQIIPPPGFRLYQNDILSFSYSCSGGGQQTSIVLIWYVENP